MKLLQIAVSVLATALVTGAASWIVFGQDKVSRQEMVDYVHNQTPWVRERGEILAGQRKNTQDISRNARAVEKMVAAQQQLIIEQRVLVTKVDRLLGE